MLRHNGAFLGRVAEQMARERWIRDQRRMVDFEEMGKEGAYRNFCVVGVDEGGLCADLMCDRCR